MRFNSAHATVSQYQYCMQLRASHTIYVSHATNKQKTMQSPNLLTICSGLNGPKQELNSTQQYNINHAVSCHTKPNHAIPCNFIAVICAKEIAFSSMVKVLSYKALRCASQCSITISYSSGSGNVPARPTGYNAISWGTHPHKVCPSLVLLVVLEFSISIQMFKGGS